MKLLSLFGILLYCFATEACAETQYFVAIQEKSDLKLSDGSSWTLEVGEVFPFVRWVSASEARGQVAISGDRSYALVQMDDKTLVVPSACMRAVPEKDIATAAMTYRQIVQQSRENNAASNAVAQQMLLNMLKQQQAMLVAPNTGLSDTDRLKMLRALKNADLITSIRASEHLSDEEIIRLMGIYEQRQEQQRLRNLEAEVHRLQQRR